jgi:hypothetical protein
LVWLAGPLSGTLFTDRRIALTHLCSNLPLFNRAHHPTGRPTEQQFCCPLSNIQINEIAFALPFVLANRSIQRQMHINTW